MKKIALRIALLVLALGCLAGIFVFPATASDAPTASIKGHNLALQDNVYIMYYAQFQNVPAGAEKGVLVWTQPQESYEYGTQSAILPYDGVQGGYEVYYFTGVSAKMMSQDIYAKAYIKNGDEITYGKLDKYSVLQYAYNKKDSELENLLTQMLNYGAAAQTYFSYRTSHLANATYCQIKVIDGTLPDDTKSGLYPVGTHVTLTATIENFDHWENAKGETIGTENPITITALESETYKTIKAEIIPEQSEYSEGLSYKSNGDGTCYILGIGTCTDTNIKIPPISPNGDSVTKIGYLAFRDCSSITTIEIPDSITSIDESAFYKCSSLQYNTYGGAKYLGNANNPYIALIKVIDSSITTISIPASTTVIYEYAFYECTALEKITFEGNSKLSSIGKFAFCDCRSLTNIAVPDSVVSIGMDAFMHCRSLISFKVPNGVAQIKEKTFQYCSSMETIILPNTITSIGSCAFADCTSLTSIIYYGTPAQWDDIYKFQSWRGSGVAGFTVYYIEQ